MTAEQRARMDAERSGDIDETPQSVQDLRRMQGGDINPSRSQPIPGANPDPNAAQPPGRHPGPVQLPG